MARRIHEETDRSSASARSLTLWRTSGENLTGTGAESLLDRLRGGPCGTWLAAWAKKSYSCSAAAGSILMSILSADNGRVGRVVLGASRPGEVEDAVRDPAHLRLSPASGESACPLAAASPTPCLSPVPGGVVSVMSPGLALRQVGSRGSSADGFRRAGLAWREVGWIPLS